MLCLAVPGRIMGTILPSSSERRASRGSWCLALAGGVVRHDADRPEVKGVSVVDTDATNSEMGLF